MMKNRLILILAFLLLCAAGANARTISTAAQLAALGGTIVNENITLAPGSYDLRNTGFDGFDLRDAVFDGGGASVILSAGNIVPSRRNTHSVTADYAGFVRSSTGGTIQNLNITFVQGGTITTNNDVFTGGIVCGRSDGGTFSNISVSGYGSAAVSVAGITLIDFGVICGYCKYSEFSGCSVSYLSFAASARYDNPKLLAGGICGNSKDSSISGCTVNYGTFSASAQTACCGSICGSGTAAISGCEAAGSRISASGDSVGYAGGIAGYCDAGGSITGCRISGIQATSQGDHSYSGGVCGAGYQCTASTCSVKYSYISSDSENDAKSGCLAGRMHESTITSCMADGCALAAEADDEEDACIGAFAGMSYKCNISQCAAYEGNEIADFGQTDECTLRSLYCTDGSTAGYVNANGASGSCSFGTSCGSGWAAANLGSGWTGTYDYGQPLYKDFLRDPVPVTGISLSRSSLSLYTGNSAVLTANVLPENADVKAVNWVSSNESVAAVSSEGVVTGTGAGTTVITAITVDGGFSAECTVKVTDPAPGAVTGVTLNKTALSLAAGKAEQLHPTVAPADAAVKTVSWTSSNTAVATVSAAGTVRAIAPGSATITVKTKDGGFKASCRVTVYIPVTGVTINKSSITLKPGKAEQLSAAIAPANATTKTVTWTSSNENIATVSAAGTVRGIAPGTAVITVRTKDGGFAARCTVTVSVPVTGITLNKAALTLKVGSAEQLHPAIEPQDAGVKTVTWTSSNTAVATVTAAGTVRGVADGKATITVRTKDGGFYAKCSVTVTSRVSVTGVTLNKQAVTLQIGKAQQLKAAPAPADATVKTVYWTSSDESVATVTAAGTVRAVSEGTAVITVRTKDGGFTASCTVTVPPAVTGVSLNKNTLTLKVGKAEQLKAAITPEDAGVKTVTWTSSDTGIATVTAAGTVRGAAPGTAVITVKTKDGGFTARCTVTITQ